MRILTFLILFISIFFAQVTFAQDVLVDFEGHLDEVENALLPLQAELPECYKPYILSKTEVLMNESKKRINALNPSIYSNKGGAYFPGGRGVNQLVIYTPSFGEKTGTNEFGTEAIVVGNVVSEISGANSLIPKDGIVISGHGTAKTWMNSALKVGTRVYVDDVNQFLYAYTTSESYLYGTEKKIAETEAMIEYYKRQNEDYKSKVPDSYIDDAKDYLKKAKRNPDNIQKYASLAIEAASDAIKSVLPYKAGELKGVWIRPTEKTREDIVNTIEYLRRAGIDDIFLETYYHGKTIYPSKVMQNYGLLAQNEIFEGTDILKIWIEEAHKRNMKIHIWFESFYVGNQNPKDNPLSILSKFPTWGNIIKRDVSSGIVATKSPTEHNGYFLDPANREVQDFLFKLIKEMTTDYKPDGVNLDYIRYPQMLSKSESGSWGYTKVSRDEFKALYGEDPVQLTRTNSLWQNWEIYRRSRITKFVRRVGEYGKQNNIYVSAVIFPDKKQALEQKLQDWQTWSKNNYIAGLTPMFLTCDSKTASLMMQDVIKNISSETDLLAGLYVTFMNGAEEDLIRQIHEARKLDAKGVVIFDYAHLGQKYASALSTSVFARTKEVEKLIEKKNTDSKKKKRRWFKKD